MRFCARCHARFPDASRFCPHDGQSLYPDEHDERIGSVLINQFELREVCGEGAMGTVYTAWQSGMERQVAVKVLRPELVREPDVVARFDREARAVARLHHPNIVTFFLIGTTDDGVPFVAMEFVEGESLEHVLVRAGKLVPNRALRVARQVTSALAEAHGEGIVHRDLKPANMILAQRRRAADLVKVLDFGIAKIVLGENESGLAGDGHVSRAGTIFGTPVYMAPEQAAGGELDARADLYSLGVVLYEMLLGQVPFDGVGLSVLLAHMHQPVPPPRSIDPHLDPRLELLLLRALEKDPAARFQTAEEMGDAIETVAAAVGADPSSWPSFSGRMPRASSSTPTEAAGASLSPGEAAGASLSPGEAAGASLSPGEAARASLSPGPAVAAPSAPPAASPSASDSAAVLSGAVVNREPAPARRSRGTWIAIVGVVAAVSVVGVSLAKLEVFGGRGQPVAGDAHPSLQPIIVTPLPVEPPPPPVPPAVRTITVGEAGYAVRVTLPVALAAGVPAELGFVVFDPSGAPATATSLAASLESAAGADQALTIAASGEPGHYALRQTFAYGGRYHMHVFLIPGNTSVHIWFDFAVSGDEPPNKPRAPRLAPAKAVTAAGGSGASDPYTHASDLKTPSFDDIVPDAAPAPALPHRRRHPKAAAPNPDGLE